MVAAIAVAPMTPMPGMVSTRWLASFARGRSRLRHSRVGIRKFACCSASLSWFPPTRANAIATAVRNVLPPALRPCAKTRAIG
jgi:hypothetical protein